jgi:Holliday junction DNA helicase RuvA
MIQMIEGTVRDFFLGGVVVDVNGVGYGAEVPLSTLCGLPKIGEKVCLWTHTHVREDSLRLFGFLSVRERDVFEVLISLNGIGPKVGMAILSTLSVQGVLDAVSYEQAHIFETTPGVGKRLSERLLVDLKPKLKKIIERFSAHGGEFALPHSSSPMHQKRDDDGFMDAIDDVKSALENLGFKEAALTKVLAELVKEKPAQDFQGLLKCALKKLTSSNTPTPVVKPSAESGVDSDLF